MAKDPSISIIRGRLAADPEYRTTGNGIPVVNLRILITRIQRGQHATPQPPQSGEYGEYTAPANDPWTN